MAAKKPLTVEVTRGDGVESRHRGDAVVVDVRGRRVHAWGAADRVVFPRSAIKPLQALVMVETGAADGFGLGEVELALACGSHSGTPEHTAAVAAWLGRIGLGEADLECGAHEPLGPDARRELAGAGETPGPLHNNCSGKHAGMLTTARHLGEPTAGYIDAAHPVQRRLTRMLEEMAECDLAQAPKGTDGCGIPVVGMPLLAMARAFARMADPDGLDPGRAAAARSIVAAMTAHPRLVAGPGRFDTLAMEAAAGAFAVKTGAEGMYAAILPGLGLGVALKIEDGARRAAEVAMAAILQVLGVVEGEAAARMVEAPVLNVSGKRVGSIRMAPDWEG